MSSLYDGSRRHKSDIVFHILGEFDELSARIGMLCGMLKEEWVNEIDMVIDLLRRIQGDIQNINSQIATVDEAKRRRLKKIITEKDTQDIELLIDHLEEGTPKLTKFILPGVTCIDSQSHLCRTQARACERNLVTLRSDGDCHVPDEVFKYVNRLSDLFFVLARYLCQQQMEKDVIMQ